MKATTIAALAAGLFSALLPACKDHASDRKHPTMTTAPAAEPTVDPFAESQKAGVAFCVATLQQQAAWDRKDKAEFRVLVAPNSREAAIATVDLQTAARALEKAEDELKAAEAALEAAGAGHFRLPIAVYLAELAEAWAAAEEAAATHGESSEQATAARVKATVLKMRKPEEIIRWEVPPRRQ